MWFDPHSAYCHRCIDKAKALQAAQIQKILVKKPVVIETKNTDATESGYKAMRIAILADKICREFKGDSENIAQLLIEGYSPQYIGHNTKCGAQRSTMLRCIYEIAS